MLAFQTCFPVDVSNARTSFSPPTNDVFPGDDQRRVGLARRSPGNASFIERLDLLDNLFCLLALLLIVNGFEARRRNSFALLVLELAGRGAEPAIRLAVGRAR